MNKLKGLIYLIKTGNPVEVKKAQKEIEHYYRISEHPLTEKNQKEFEIFIDEVKNFDQIKNINNQMYFVHTLKWPFMLIGDKYFDFFADFIVDAIQHHSGKVRQAIIKTVDWLLITNTVSIKGLGKKFSDDEMELHKKSREVFCTLVFRVKELINKYHEPRFNRYKYISSLPVSIYKSLQTLLYENLLRSPFYEKMYNKWLLSNPRGLSRIPSQQIELRENNYNSVMQFKVSINYSKPIIWRRIVVPSDYSFFELHCAIQNAFGWSDSHLHGFYIAQKGTARPIMIKYPDPENCGFDFFDKDEDKDERVEKIADYFGKQVKQCQYTYDFGDSWDHTILFEKESKAEPDMNYPLCSAGSGACPIEDSGGIGGYERLLKILKNPKHKEYEEMCEWLGIENGNEIDQNELDLSEIYFEDPKQMQEAWDERFQS